MKLVLGLLVGISILTQSCSKDDDSMYATKEDYIYRDEILQKNGSTILSITGKSQDGYALNETLELNS